MKIIIVGGVAGGATAAARLRRLDETAEILLLERGEFVSFANCGLPYYLGGTIKSRDALFVSDIPSITGKYGIEIRNFSEVTKIRPEEKTIEIADRKNGREYTEPYDVLLLSTGSTPFVPEIPGKEAENVFTLWNIPDTDRIYRFIEEKRPGKALVTGGGFIGIEMAENLHDRGMEVTLAEFAGQVMPPFDPDMAKLLEDHMRAKGIRLLLNTGLSAVEGSGKTAVMSDGSRVETDMILLSVGVRPNSALAKEAGLAVGQRGGVIVDERMKTSDPSIYAIGDMIEIVNPLTGGKGMVPLAGPANKQGRAVAANILGMKAETYDGTLGTSVAKVFDMTAASVGLNEKALKAAGKVLWNDYGIALIHPMSHAGYYPGAAPMTLKLLFDMADGRILGAQIAGYDGVDKRIDTIASSIHYRGTVYDLTKLELAYAPPYSSAKDPVNMAGYVASNILEGLTEPITWEEYEAGKDSFTLIDVREEAEFAMGTIEGALRMPLTSLRSRLGELDTSTSYVVYCAVGLRGYLTERILKQAGFTVRNLQGGYRTFGDRTRSDKAGDGKNAGGTGGLGRGSADARRPASTDQDKLKSGEQQSFHLDACGLSCPGPIVRVSKRVAAMQEGEILSVEATDPGFVRDIESWCDNTGNTLLDTQEDKGKFTAKIRKGCGAAVCAGEAGMDTRKEKTMIVFDGDLDKAIAAFIIATGSAAMGNKVNMFFTFWGLNILRRPEKTAVQKDLVGKLFGMMMPRGSGKLALSKMNFAGLGSGMMRAVMKKKGIASLEELIAEARDAGVKLTACQMSMDVMGITREELIEGVEIGGVASMLNDNDHSNMNLFI
ncbi:FAD-dependent oxidoreductase [Lachnoclostridium sp. Marseille-P6806]|uniref:FAD-dependent oxidoreductase n=1 Tax=Lachnoclostridium sp. Marseille-P6806 TaxID=2364793 RepID=UPI00102F57D0|nr:FAD-dependent oxidoreductase [Lachnoclostridium sp. Marseille-P6806]